MAKAINMWQHKLWGDNIGWFDFEKRKICGWYSGLKKGDFIRAEMKSEKIASFKIVKIEYESNPSDMFFATIKDVGYVYKNGKFATKEDVVEADKLGIIELKEV